MAGKRKVAAKKKPQAKRVVTEIAPGVRRMLDGYMKAYNDGPERVSSPLKYTDIVNLALDSFLPGRPEPAGTPDESAPEGSSSATAEQAPVESPMTV
ncbi:hypothetical protein [Geothrix sp. 21YS21S-2]|uniref:hypothetical protein n=1 Tax=Geothrix sp. 21YS21S-2 TaxID=3068893 RepID=UPI0027B8CB01|nr:hypothetical protein [Geothrix sp. 21YS21S-2]